MSLAALLLLVALAAAALGVLAVVALRVSGAQPRIARRLAGPAEVRVGELVTARDLPARTVRVVGRIRCPDALISHSGERLVAFHRDVEVEMPNGWRSIERVRETRSFELWDHDGSVSVDPSHFAEPLIGIPTVWRGTPDEITDPNAAVVRRLRDEAGPGRGPARARAVTRTIAVTDRLLLLAMPRRDADGRLRLDPPRAGQLASTLALPDAMRLLGGPRRRLAVASIAVAAMAGLVGTAALVAAGAAWVLGG